jgi:ribonuclease HI
MTTLALYCDGLCEPRNPGGYACWAWLAKSPAGRTIRTSYGCLGYDEGMSNNLAEYESVLQALRYTVGRVELLRERGLSVRLHSDSQLTIRQITGEYRVNAPHLLGLWHEAIDLAAQIRAAGVPLEFVWIPREQNEEADNLTCQAYQEARRVAQVVR